MKPKVYFLVIISITRSNRTCITRYSQFHLIEMLKKKEAIVLNYFNRKKPED